MYRQSTSSRLLPRARGAGCRQSSRRGDCPCCSPAHVGPGKIGSPREPIIGAGAKLTPSGKPVASSYRLSDRLPEAGGRRKPVPQGDRFPGRPSPTVARADAGGGDNFFRFGRSGPQGIPARVDRPYAKCVQPSFDFRPIRPCRALGRDYAKCVRRRMHAFCIKTFLRCWR